MRVLCFGHPDVEQDNMALRVAARLHVPDFTFEAVRSPERLLEETKPFVILDVAPGISEPRFVDNLSQVRPPRLVSLHDFDLGYFLKLHERLGDLPKFKILAVPQYGDVERIAKKVKELLITLK